jgi:sugar phosphate isomerase/epimerase
MILSAVTVSLVPEARGGPFIFWDDLEAACASASRLGFDAIELFAPSASEVAVAELDGLLSRYRLRLAAVGTGAGMVKHRLSLTDPDAERRKQARLFAGSLIEFGSHFGAPAIIGSMQGRCATPADRPQALAWLRDALEELGQLAQQRGSKLIFEPVNRYETNLINSIVDGAAFVQSLSLSNVGVLADLFHMNIEESSLEQAIRQVGKSIAHVHFADSNRRPAGNGHTDFPKVIAALREIGYHGYLSAEALAWPDSETAAATTIHTFKQLIS